MTKKELFGRKFITNILLFITATVGLFTGYIDSIVWCGFMTAIFGIYNHSNIKEKIQNLVK